MVKTHIDVLMLFWNGYMLGISFFTPHTIQSIGVYFTGLKIHHKTDPNISPSKINFADKLDINGKGEDLRKSKAHGNHFKSARSNFQKIHSKDVCVKLEFF